MKRPVAPQFSAAPGNTCAGEVAPGFPAAATSGPLHRTAVELLADPAFRLQVAGSHKCKDQHAAKANLNHGANAHLCSGAAL